MYVIMALVILAFLSYYEHLINACIYARKISYAPIFLLLFPSMLIYPYCKFNGDLTTTSLNFEHGWIIISHYFTWMWLLSRHCIISCGNCDFFLSNPLCWTNLFHIVQCTMMQCRDSHCTTLLGQSLYSPQTQLVSPISWYSQHIEDEVNSRHFADHIFKVIFLNEKCYILLKFVTRSPIHNDPALILIMAWSTGYKPFSALMMA